MAGFSLGKSTSSSNQTTNNTQTAGSGNTDDNRVAIQSGSVVTTGGGALNQGIQAGDGASINVSSVDPGSFAFASHVVDQAMKANADVTQVASGIIGGVTDAVGKLAQGTTLGTTDWKKWLIPGAIVVVLVIGAVLLFRRK
jgi:hypothetical protein